MRKGLEKAERTKEGKESLWRKPDWQGRARRKDISGHWPIFVPTVTNASLIVLRRMKDAGWHRSVSSSSSCWKCDPLEVFPSRKEKLHTTIHGVLYETAFTKDRNMGVHLPMESRADLQSPLAIPPLLVWLWARDLHSDMQTWKKSQVISGLPEAKHISVRYSWCHLAARGPVCQKRDFVNGIKYFQLLNTSSLILLAGEAFPLKHLTH